MKKEKTPKPKKTLPKEKPGRIIPTAAGGPGPPSKRIGSV